MQRCCGAFNAAPSPSSNFMLWPSCSLDVHACVAALAVHSGDAGLLANRTETYTNLRHWTSPSILYRLILLQVRSQSVATPASAIINQLGIQWQLLCPSVLSALKITPP